MCDRMRGLCYQSLRNLTRIALQDTLGEVVSEFIFRLFPTQLGRAQTTEHISLTK